MSEIISPQSIKQDPVIISNYSLQKLTLLTTCRYDQTVSFVFYKIINGDEMTKKDKSPEEVRREQSFQTWLKSIQFTKAGQGYIEKNLKAVYFFVQDWLSYDGFIDAHAGLQMRKWPEAKILLRDIQVCDLLLKKLNSHDRIHALAALNGFKSAKEIAELLDKPVTTINSLFQKNSKPKRTGSAPGLISSLAKLLDVPDEFLLYDDISYYRNNFNNLLRVENTINSNEVLTIFNSNKKEIDYYKVEIDFPLSLSTSFVAKLRSWRQYRTIELYSVYEIPLTHYLNTKDLQIDAIVYTSALLRGTSKVILYRNFSSRNDQLIEALKEMRLRKYTFVTVFRENLTT
ncbi:hypothetical protein [Paenibacillus andongensis]|uniref:hypothetical protein n=1 Tax=Paenibacillus andongensis TaxID=2975482 RepID=UPI0021BB6A1D|nr:hypothetical protein [Paenibacillus andongensis]